MNTANLKKIYDFGLIAIPIKSAKEKIPRFKGWESVKKITDIPKFAVVKFQAIGLLAEPSGVCIIDIDVKNDPSGRIGSDFLQSLEVTLDNFEDLLIQTTPSGGFHIIYKTDPVPDTIKLAKYKTGVVIETRGRGGQALIYPSPGYEIHQGSFKSIPTLSKEDSDLIFSIARSFDKVPDKKIQTRNKKVESKTGSTPFKKFNEQTNIVELLTDAGWSYVEDNDLGSLVLRPGKSKARHSGIVFKESNRFFCHTTSTDFKTDQAYSAFDVNLILGKSEPIMIAQILDKFSEEPKLVITPQEPDPVAPEFPFEILPSIVRDYIWTHEHFNVTLPDFSAMTFITLIGAILGTRTSIESRTGWVSHATLWVAMSAAKGKNKTESMGIIVDPITKHTNELSKYYLAEKKHAEDSQVPFSKANPQFIVNDITFEALGILMNQSEKGVMMVQQELDSWVTSMTEYSSESKSNKWIGFHDNKSTAVNRVTRQSIIIDNPSCPVIGPIQPAILSKLMNDPDMVHSGFVDRLLIVNPDHEFREIPEQEMNPDIIETYQDYIIELFKDLRYLQPRKYVLEGEAKKQFMIYINDLRRRQNQEEIQSMIGFYDKISKYMSRFILIIHMFQAEIKDQIQIETVQKAFKLVQYFVGMNLKTYNQNARSKDLTMIHQTGQKKYPDQSQKRYLYLQKCGMSYKDISSFENKSVSAIKTGIHRAKKQ